jgi:UDP-N-acetylmuramoyl-L-alanyl-D-glutamate--2,6-diaminopimelate ligase
MTHGSPAPTRSMGLGALADRIEPLRVVGLPVGQIEALAYDSRRVGPRTLFFAVPGEHVDGHQFAADAVDRGAVALVVEREVERLEVPQLIVENSRHALADAADAWFGEPSRRLQVIGVTGTDGKTTTSFLCAEVLRAAGRHPGLIGTVALRVGGRQLANDVRATTPEALELHELLARMVAAGDDSVVLEASSHGLAQGRVRNCRFAMGIVTNLTQEHLEFHKTLEAYREAKARLVAEAELAILNRDDAHFRFFAQRAAGRVLTYGLDAAADVRAAEIEAGVGGSRFRATTASWSGIVEVPMPGRFNVWNALAALTLAEALEIEPGVAAAAIGQAEGVPGRMERIEVGQPFSVVVDYAHTADALEKVLAELRPVTQGRLFVVFGSAGERDRVKRPAMGRVAAQHADVVIVADEDPRLEPSDEINEQVAAGAREAGARPGENLFVIADRRAAIAHAIGMARSGDVLLLAGKGHEGSIIYGSESRWWDEAEVARQELRAAGYSNEVD